MKLLEYENQMFLDLFHEDGLIILAKGLGLERVFLSLIKVYNDPGNLVIIIGTYAQEEEYFLEQLAKDNVTPLPKVITADYGTNERHSVYMEGGVLFVTSRILVVDMLTNRVPFDLITGIIVYKAHKIIESCQEAFILRLYRLRNQKGFVKALSSSPYSFTQGFCQVQRVMRNLFVRKLYLWPRFHADISVNLEKKQSHVIEIHVSLTPIIKKIQIAILDIMAITVKEIAKINPTIDTDEVTVENVISKAFDKVIKYQLDPVWHQLGTKTKRSISDLKTLRVLLGYLTQYDAVTFYFLIKSIRDNVEVNTQISDWLLLSAAQTVFICAKERVFGVENKRTKEKPKLRPNPTDIEINPKWVALIEIIGELEKDFTKPETIVIVVEDERTAAQLQDLLSVGPNALLRKIYNRHAKGSGFLPIFGKKYMEKKGISKGPPMSKLSRKRKPTSQDEESDKEDTNGSDDDEDVNKTYNEDLIKLNFFIMRGTNRPFGFKEKLDELNPKYFVIYDMDVRVVRELEVYQALNLNHQLKIYFVVYGGSVEEQRYLTILRKEKEAFEYLIREKSNMVIPEDRDGKSGDHPDLERGSHKASDTVSTRKAGGMTSQTTSDKPLIIVDAREFRSELPALIHRKGIDIEPITIEVGDYILTPDMCVERKSLSDLIGSLNNGRLYNQATAMSRYYKRPLLLIEFDQNKSFSLQGKYFSSTKESSTTLMSKLILLTMHFTRLRMLWSPSPYATAEMFEMLKMNKEQPTAEQALKVTAQVTKDDIPVEKYNPGPQDFLSKLPGVNTKNIRFIMNKVKSLFELMTLSEEQINAILENSANAKILWEALHQKVAVRETQGKAGGRGGFTKRGRFRFGAKSK